MVIAWTQRRTGAYDEAFVPDALRAVNCVPSRAATQAFLARLRTGDMSEPQPVCPEDAE